jgi:two-component system, NtrC family, response regulator GlrR
MQSKILVVDDDINLLNLIHMRLETSGYTVVAANHENIAKEVASQEVFDVAIVDLQLVKQDGLSLMEELHDIHPDMSVIIMTAHGSREIEVEAMKRGAFNYLVKPFDSRELILQIERAQEKNYDR